MINKVYADFNSSFRSVKGNDPLSGKYGTMADVINQLVPYILVLIGFLLLIFLISGGIDMLTSAGDQKKAEQAKEKITAAIVGFIITFAGFWIYQIVAFMLGIKIS